ncbi:glycosyltransferase family 25 protein [Castellaniella ginsengisoli]|uniref:Glycosyltransferase family 25 protein n=1 Tax=Castellaniella ginsengisoli TaxID=546114 RepID=A0AB39CHA2_9BURK
MSTIPIRVISLASRTDRRRQVAEQFARLGVAGYSFLDAVNGKEQPDHPLFAHYDPAARARRKGRGRDLKPSQLGCFASHYLLWQECAASGRPMVVVEDDALLQDNFPDLLIRASQLAERWPLIWLHGYDRSGRDPVMAVGRMGPFTLVRKLKRHSCTVAYLLSPAGAEALLAHCGSWVYPVDDTMIRFYEHGVESILLQPPCVAQDHDSPSDIRGAENRPMPWPDKIRREFYKACDEIRRVWHNLRFRLRFRRPVS